MARELDIIIKLEGTEAAERGLKRVDAAIDGVESSAKTAGGALDGVDAELKALGPTMDTITNRAGAYAQKIVQLGGATKLTADEQRKATTVITAGIAEYERMGAVVPGMVKRVHLELTSLATASKVAAVETEALAGAQAAAGPVASKLAGLTTLLGGATLAAGAAFVAALPMAVKYASSLEQIGVSSGAGAVGAQRFENIAVRTGVTMQAVASGATSLSERIAGKDKSAVAAMNALHVSTEDFLNLRPDDRFILVASALGQVADAGQRATLAKDLFSNWQEILPTLTTDVNKFADSIHLMSEAEVADLAKVEREWKALVTEVKRDITQLVALAISPIVFVVKITWEGASDVARFAANPGSFLTNGLVDTVGAGGYSPMTGRPGRQTSIELPFTGLNMAPKSPFGFLGSSAAIDPSLIGSVEINGKNLTQQNEATKEAIKLADQKAALLDRLSGHDAIATASTWTSVVEQVGGVTKLAKADQEQYNKVLVDALAAYRALGAEAPAALRKLAVETSLLAKARTIGSGMATSVNGPIPTSTGLDPLSFSTDLAGVATFANGNARPLAEQRGIFGPAKLASKTFDTGPASGGLASDLASSVPNSILAAIQGGGSKLQAAGSAIGMTLFGQNSALTKSITGMFSANGILGKTLSSAVPIIGSLIGPAMEGLGKLWGKVFGTAGRDAVRDFATKNGGFDALHEKLGLLGGADGETLWKSLTQGVGRNNPEQAKAEIEKVTKAFAAFEQGVKDANVALGQTTEKLSHVTQITPEVKAGLEAALNAKTPQEFLAALTNVNSQLDATAQKHQHLKDLADKYGISLKDMGHAFAQEEIDQKAKGLIDDFKDLTEGGADATAVMKGMAGQYSELVQAAKESGTELPNSMRPTLQKLIDMGDLVDKNGVKLTNLDGINFGDSLETRLGDIKDVVLDLKKAIEDLALAFRGLPSNLPALPASPAGANTSPRSQADTSGISDSPDYSGGYDGTDPGTYVSHTGSIIRAAGLERFHTGGALLRQVGWKTLSQQLGLAGDERAIIGQVGEGILNRGAMANMSASQFHAMNRGVDPARIFEAANRGGVVGPSLSTPTVPANNAEVVAAINRSTQAASGDAEAIAAAVERAVAAALAQRGDTVVTIDGRELVRAVNRVWNQRGELLSRSRELLG